jgi:serine/threonine protein kinase
LVHIGRGLLRLHSAKIVPSDFKPGNVFITKKRTYKIGRTISYAYYFISLLIGDYGISRSIGITMTMGIGTMYEVNGNVLMFIYLFFYMFFVILLKVKSCCIYFICFLIGLYIF